jgi:hypothetical protein
MKNAIIIKDSKGYSVRWNDKLMVEGLTHHHARDIAIYLNMLFGEKNTINALVI